MLVFEVIDEILGDVKDKSEPVGVSDTEKFRKESGVSIIDPLIFIFECVFTFAFLEMGDVINADDDDLFLLLFDTGDTFVEKLKLS